MADVPSSTAMEQAIRHLTLSSPWPREPRPTDAKTLCPQLTERDRLVDVRSVRRDLLCQSRDFSIASTVLG